MRAQKRQTVGFTLIEVLIALVVLSVGLLGLAGMQLVGLRSNSSATFRSQATAVATDMAERMRANPGADFNGIDSNANPCTAPATVCNLDTSNCTPQQMADFDIYEVSCGTNGVKLFPSGRLQIALVGTTYDVTVSWTELLRDGTQDVRSVVMTLQ